MKIAVMQPYFLPYLGYFQLIASVDKFVILDDVHYINRGWINRNRIPNGDSTRWLTLPLRDASQNRLICDLDILPDDGWKAKMQRAVSACYSKAPERLAIMSLMDQWLQQATGNLSAFLARTLADITGHCGIFTEIVHSSRIYPKGSLSGQQRILDICVREGASIYVNPPGGIDLYDPSLFAAVGLELRFLKPQLTNLGIRSSGLDGPVLSILDLMMFNTPDALHKAVYTFDDSIAAVSKTR